MKAPYSSCDATSGAPYPTRSATTPHTHSNANIPNPNIASVSPISFGLACSCLSSRGTAISSRPVASVANASAAMRPPLRLRMSDSVMRER